MHRNLHYAIKAANSNINRVYERLSDKTVTSKKICDLTVARIPAKLSRILNDIRS